MKEVSEYDQEMLQSQTTEQPSTLLHWDIKQSNLFHINFLARKGHEKEGHNKTLKIQQNGQAL